MFRLVSLFVVLCIISVVINATPLDYFNNERIVNGTDAKEGEFPYVVSLRTYGFSHNCGGSIINSKWILTAAHCVIGSSASRMSIQYGVTKISSDRFNVVKVKKSIYHKEYNSFSLENDIALLELESPLKFNEFVQPVKLPKQNEITPANSKAVLIGWGRNATGSPVMQHLQKVDLLIFSHEECSRRHNAQIYKSNICAGVPEGGKGQCNGDSGGPLTVNGTQVGVVSWSIKPCTVAPYPGVLTRVSSYIDWIEETIKNA